MEVVTSEKKGGGDQWEIGELSAKESRWIRDKINTGIEVHFENGII